jgi:hypothetical protein
MLLDESVETVAGGVYGINSYDFNLRHSSNDVRMIEVSKSTKSISIR